jgi:hypothetical protein
VEAVIMCRSQLVGEAVVKVRQIGCLGDCLANKLAPTGIADNKKPGSRAGLFVTAANGAD